MKLHRLSPPVVTRRHKEGLFRADILQGWCARRYPNMVFSETPEGLPVVDLEILLRCLCSKNRKHDDSEK